MIILGIDPALSKLGWGIINAESSKLSYLGGGTICTNPKELIHHRLAMITNRLEQIIVQYNPTIVAMEETFININAASSLKLGYARGAVMALIGRLQLEFVEFKPNAIKKAVVGVGHAEKQQILHMIKLLIIGAESVTSFDEADAIATAYTCSVYRKIQTTLILDKKNIKRLDI